MADEIGDINYAELTEMLRDHQSALDLLINWGLVRPPETCDCLGPVSARKDERLRDGYYLRCNDKNCNRSFSVRSGSWFSGVSISLDTFLKLLYFWCQNFTITQVIHELRLGHSAVISMFGMFRQVCDLEFSSETIGGPGIVVQIDESHLFTRKYHVGRVLKSEKFWIFGGVDERGNFLWKGSSRGITKL